MLSLRKFNITLLVLLMVAGLDFYGLRLIKPGSLLDLFARFYPVLLVLLSLYHAYTTKVLLFNRAIKLILFAMFLSTFMAYITWDQNWISTMRITIPYMLFAYVFYLYKVNMQVKVIEKWLIIFGLIYFLFYFIQLASPGNVIFGNRGIAEARGSLRFILPGYAFYIVTTFIAFIKFSDKSNRYHLYWGLIGIVGLIVTVLQVTRQNIAAIAIILFVHFFRNTPNNSKIPVIFLLGAVIVYLTYFENPIYSGLAETIKETTANVDTDIRVLAAQYFLTEYSPQTINRILGNGVAQGTKSEFGEHNIYLAEVLRVDMTDVGFFGFYAMFGVLGILGYLMIWYTSIKYPLPKRYHYLKYFLWYIFLTGFTSYAMIKIDMFLVTTLVIYMYQKVYQEQYFPMQKQTVKVLS